MPYGLKSADRDLVALGIAIAAILLFIATGGSVYSSISSALLGQSNGPDNILVTALLLNIALVIFGWRRYQELSHEVSERRRAEAHARELAEIDPLTGCLNRRRLTTATDELRAEANEEGKAIAFGMIDLDNFKQVNDMHGHSVGDRMLVNVADRIAAVLPERSLLARLGGDEFAFVVTFHPSSTDRVDDLVIRLFAELSQPFDLDGVTLEMKMSIGVTADLNDENGNPVVSSAEELLHRADIAMYNAKKQGKNRFFWFEPAMENELRFRNELEVGIRSGLANQEFVPFYEQQIDLDSGELVGFEMLARWESPDLGMVSPEVFIPIAEEIGAIDEMSQQLMVQAFQDASHWDDKLTLSVNVSPVQLRDPWFAQKLLKMLVAHGFPPKRLELEVTESCLHDNIGMVRSMMTSLQNQGVRITLDDFGTGYSTLEQMRALPFERLKIDRSFVSELSNPEARSTIVDAIVSLGRGLNMPITAEGIEDEQILKTLRLMGSLKGQGYLYGRPEPADRVQERLREKGLLAAKEPQGDTDPAPAQQSAMEALYPPFKGGLSAAS